MPLNTEPPVSPLNGVPADRMYRTQAVRAVETQALALTLPGELMSRAADAVASVCSLRLRTLPARTPVLALVGPGNNGGDALLAAHRLARQGWAVSAVGLPPPGRRPPDAERALSIWLAEGRVLQSMQDLGPALATRPLVIDGLYGIGARRGLDAQSAEWVQQIRDARVPVVAVDLPSGLDADTGAILGGDDAPAMQAEITVSLLVDKPGLHTGRGPDLAGRIVQADLGLPALPIRVTWPQAASEDPALWGKRVDGETLGPVLHARSRSAHKGQFGELLVVAGSPAMQGASQLALLGAQAVGVGRLFLAHPASAYPVPRPIEAMARELSLHSRSGEECYGRANAIVIGCGAGRDESSRLRLERALDHPAALLIDADGLNLLAEHAHLRAALRRRRDLDRVTVLTPHPLEAARMLTSDTGHVQGDRIAAACALARQTGACVVLKGAGTVVALPDGRWSVNVSGGPLLSVAGTGDVLAGVIGGLLAQGLSTLDAAQAGVWLHGAAGDALAATGGWSAGIGLFASALPQAIRDRINQRAARR